MFASPAFVLKYLKYVINVSIYGQSINNKREYPGSVMLCGVQKIKHQQFYKNIQMNENGFSWIKIHFSCI